MQVPDKVFLVHSRTSGYVVKWCMDKIVDQAKEYDVVVRYNVHMGQFVSEHSLLAYVWPRESTSDSLGKIRDVGKENLSKLVHGGITCANIRTADNDPSLGIRQLTDIAVRALSPGINDPQTAVQVMDACCAVFAELCSRELGNEIVRSEDDNVVRVAAQGLTFNFLISIMMNPIRGYGSGDVTVTRRALLFLEDVGAMTNVPSQIAEVRQHVEAWRAVSKRHFGEDSLEARVVSRVADRVAGSIDAKRHDAWQDTQKNEEGDAVRKDTSDNVSNVLDAEEAPVEEDSTSDNDGDVATKKASV